MTCNLNLLCKDGYIISLALFVWRQIENACLSMSRHNFILWIFMLMYYTSYIFHLPRKTACITLLEVFCSVKSLELTVLLGLFFNLHAKSVNGGFVNWSEKFTGLKCFREIYIGHCSLSSK